MRKTEYGIYLYQIINVPLMSCEDQNTSKTQRCILIKVLVLYMRKL
jgi:hypothetical protein